MSVRESPTSRAPVPGRHHQVRVAQHRLHDGAVVDRPPLAERRVAVEVDDLVEVQVVAVAVVDRAHASTLARVAPHGIAQERGERARAAFVLARRRSEGEVRVPIHEPGRSALAVATLLSLAAAPPVRASDWPQLWGPSVTGAVEAANPPSGVSLRELWRRPIGSAFSAVSVVGERGYTGRVGREERRHGGLRRQDGPHAVARVARRDLSRPRRLARRSARDARGERRPRVHGRPARPAAGARRGERPRAVAQGPAARARGEAAVLRLRRVADRRRRAGRAPGRRCREERARRLRRRERRAGLVRAARRSRRATRPATRWRCPRPSAASGSSW